MLKLDKILFICSCTYLIGVLGWLGSQNKLPGLNLQLTSVSAKETKLADQEFIAYLQNSLENIDRQVNYQEKNKDQNTPQTTPEDFTQKPQKRRPELQRVYLPLYQPPTIIAQPTPPPPEIPPPPPPPSITPNLETGQIAATSKETNCILIGWLTIEDSAIALFALDDGVTERVKAGEAIGNTGWTLIDIVSEKALVQKQQQIKTISVGQAF